MAEHDYDLIVLGAGAAGLTVTAGAAQLGVKVLLVEREPLLGGDCLHNGCVPSKTLISSARVFHQMRNARQWGLPQPEFATSESPVVDFSAVSARIRSVIADIQPHDSPERFRRLGAEVAFGDAAFMDANTIRIARQGEAHGAYRTVSAPRIVIATGSSPQVPPIPGLADVRFLTNKDIFALPALPKSLIVLGGGPIAMEMAQAFRRLGSEVTVIQRSAQILSKEDKDMADIVQQAMQREGVRFMLNTAVRQVRYATCGSCTDAPPAHSAADRQSSASLSPAQQMAGTQAFDARMPGSQVADSQTPGSQATGPQALGLQCGTGERPVIAVDIEQPNGMPHTLYADSLFVAMGRTPNVQGLQLEHAGVDYSAKGIAVDARMRTSRKHIFACGDVTGQYQFTHAAGYEGGIVLANAVFRLPRKADYTWLPWATFTDPELASIGMNEKAARARNIAYTVRTEPFSGNDRARAEGETEGMLKMLLDKRGKVLGVQIAGPHAGELINEWVAVLGGGVSLATLAGGIHPYPTLGEINKRAAGNLLGEKLFSNRVRALLRLLFRYRGSAGMAP